MAAKTFYLKDAVVEPVTINALANGLTGASQTETLICPATVDGAYCDDGNLCNGRETCKAGTCTSNPPPVCDINSTLAPAGLTSRRLMSCGKVWVRPLTVTVALATSPVRPET